MIVEHFWRVIKEPWSEQLERSINSLERKKNNMNEDKLVTQKDLVEQSGLSKRQVFYAVEKGYVKPLVGRRGSGNTQYFDPLWVEQLRRIKARLDWGLSYDAAWREDGPNGEPPLAPNFNFEVKPNE